MDVPNGRPRKRYKAAMQADGTYSKPAQALADVIERPLADILIPENPARLWRHEPGREACSLPRGRAEVLVIARYLQRLCKLSLIGTA
jgi:hypothetical protein